MAQSSSKNNSHRSQVYGSPCPSCFGWAVSKRTPDLPILRQTIGTRHRLPTTVAPTPAIAAISLQARIPAQTVQSGPRGRRYGPFVSPTTLCWGCGLPYRHSFSTEYLPLPEKLVTRAPVSTIQTLLVRFASSLWLRWPNGL